RDFLPDLDAIPDAVANRARLLWINYPNNPTAAVASLEFFERVLDFARRYDLLVCHDNAYSDVAYDGYRAPSLLELPGAKDLAVEFNSLYMTYNMTGLRRCMNIGNLVADEELGRTMP